MYFDWFQYHPDTCGGGDTEQNTKNFQKVLEAYKTLTKNRATYDANQQSAFSDHTGYSARSVRNTYNPEWFRDNSFRTAGWGQYKYHPDDDIYKYVKRRTYPTNSRRKFYGEDDDEFYNQ